MLKKSFKTAKCKTSLKLATSRIKLMKNKKGVQINQMKKELAQLLEAGDDRTARIRVEHVIREEKMVAAYDLIDIYCELIVARLPIIESQKTCPIDLKEAVTSVIFAAPRCSDIPELVDAKKHFTAKYGKEFVSAALELRPDSGVSRMLIEKLSAVAPDVQTKVKVLSAVAKEHNINWDAPTFEERESKPPDDLLNGHTNFAKVTTITVDSPKVQTSNVHNVHSYEGNANEHIDFAQQNKRFTIDAQTVTAADSGSFHRSFASSTHEDMRSSGLGSGTINISPSFHSNYSNSSSGKEKWNIEFKDATSAAQAAAESAELASYAARAAAELSSQGKITRQYSTESYNSEPKPEVSSKYTGQHSFKDSYNNASFNDRKQTIQTTQIDTSPKATKKSSSLRSRNDSVNGNLVSDFEIHESSSNKEFRSRFTNRDNEGSFKSTNVGYYKDDVFKKQPSITPSQVIDQEKRLGETAKCDGASSDDESDSDDGPRYDMEFEYDEGEAKSFFPSPDREPFCPPEETHIASPKKNRGYTTDRVDSGKIVDHSVKFDHLDGLETETKMSKLSSSGSKKSTSRVDPGYGESPPKVNPTKSRIELNDLVETGSSFHNDYDELDTGINLKFGTLTGGLKNKGSFNSPLYMKTAFKEESPVASKQTSFNSRASRSENKTTSVSESDSDDDIEPIAVPKSFKFRSQFAPPDKFFSNDESDYEEEVSPVSKRTSTGKVHLGPGLSRRTKGQVEPIGKTVVSNPDTHHVSLQTTSTSAVKKPNTPYNITKSPPKRRPEPARYKQEPFRTKPEPKIPEPSPKPIKKFVESGKTEAPKEAMNMSPESKLEANNVKKPSHVHPKLPEYDSLAARIQALNKMSHQ